MSFKALGLFLVAMCLNTVVFAGPHDDPAGPNARRYTGTWAGSCMHPDDGSFKTKFEVTFDASKYPEVFYSSGEISQDLEAFRPKAIIENTTTWVWSLIVSLDGSQLNVIVTDMIPDMNGGLWYRESRWDYKLSEDFSTLKVVDRFTEYQNGQGRNRVNRECILKPVQK